MPTFRQDEKLGTKVPLIKTADFNDKSVTTEKLAEGSVTNSKLAPESVTQDKFDKELLQIFKAAAGLPENLIETIQNVDSTLVDHQRQISSNDEDISDLQTKTKQIKDTVDGIAVSGGASVGSAVTYDNTQSGLDALNIQNAIDELVNNLGHYETNEEWLRAYTDAENKFLWGIRIDGSIDWAVGIPRPIQKKIEELIATDTAIQESITQLRTELTESLNKKIQSLKDNEIKNLQDTKVDKEEGKSLIEDEVKECFRIIENEEFLKAIVDSDDKVLFGFYRATGKPYYPQNDMYHISQSEEFLWVILDAANHPLLGIQQDGTCWAAKAQWLDDIKAIKEALKTFQPKEDGKGLINLDVADSFFYISNDEYIIAVVDAENRILAGIKYDGNPYFPNHEMYSVITNEEWLYAIIDAGNKVLGGFRADDGHMVVGGIDISTFIANAIIDIADIKERTAHLSTIVNDEYLSVETDAEGKVIGYIAPDGSHYLYKVKSETIPTEFEHIEDHDGRTEITTDAEDKILGYRDSEGTRHEHKISTKHLELSNEAAKEVNEAFKSAGIKMDNPSDFSKDSHIELPIPRIAAQVRIYAPKLPTTKTDDIEAEIEYNDKDGNYFRKPVILNTQGQSSMYFYVKNMAIDINDGSDIKFGDFPEQDSFHLKKYYVDNFRGQCIVGYWLMEQVYKSHPIGQQYPYESILANNSTTNGIGKSNKDFFTGAKCHPDGFPIIITWINQSNGEETLMGVYAWNLKKSKEVYYADKKKTENIILDGIIGNTEIWGGKINWTQFEIRNPKSLKDINENKYDGDNPKELSDTDTFSKSVKAYITHLSEALTNLKSNQTKEEFEKYFLVNPFIDYFLVSQVLYNWDGFNKNWIWCTWDGLHWTPTLYDVDLIFGLHANGISVKENSDTSEILGISMDLPSGYLNTLYSTEIAQRYKELRDANIFNVINITDLLSNWLKRIGYKNIKEEFNLYDQTPSYRASNTSDKWKYLYWSWSPNYPTSFSDTKTYSKGELVYYYGGVYEALEETTGVPPTTKLYTKYPEVGGCYNSLQRVANWIENRIDFLDKTYNYK
ncbi:CotH kinase family protein [Segatella copri]|uniref:Uncharacterized protein n=1 Tax=Segatella copri TaxID=165179 RepID=A0A3R5ZXL2_9BACT|nr:CotH kinase family protein [Segatella copri]RGS17992.1 hypothetical protein DWY11_04210 [Segatella copri]